MELSNIRKTNKGLCGFGGYWKQGVLHKKDLKKVIVRSAAGDKIIAGTRVTAYWPDGSVKWTGHDALASDMGESVTIELSDKPESFKNTFKVTDNDEGELLVDNGYFQVALELDSDYLFKKVSFKGKTVWADARPFAIMDEPIKSKGLSGFVRREYFGRIKTVTVEEEGPASFVIKYEGVHVDKTGREAFPFVIRMIIGYRYDSIDFTHTFMYDGDENKDFLAGMGIEAKVSMEGELYNRHLKFETGQGVYHEALLHLTSWRPRIPVELYARQMSGEAVLPKKEDKELIDKVIKDSPIWDEYVLSQSELDHFEIKKKLEGKDLSFVHAFHGTKSGGVASVSSLSGSTLFAVRDFWEKYPAGFRFAGLSKSQATCRMMFWSDEASHMDFRHYANRGYNQVCYEGYDYKGASPDGIAVTSHCSLTYRDDPVPSDQDLTEIAQIINKPAIFVSTPEFYHENRVFGYWSLASHGSEVEDWIELQLSKAFSFYKNEVATRKWYGLFNYGDFMHTYDGIRHNWKYDQGGYAWDNTELVPTLWLWLYFLRTGREDVFSLAENLSRHASEIDVYHFGRYKGLGSRHNVSHWGCPCKEARIAMAGHHRYLYYLTADRRFEDIFDELKDNELSFLNKDPLGDFFEKKDMVFPSHARSGPDWSSLVSNWMTEWERHNDKKYRDKIITGLKDIKAAPLKLSSGPDFEFDPKSCHLRYIGERTTGGTHLQVCMGAPSIWMETADLLEDEEFKEMIARHGRFYFLSHEDQLKESGGIIGNRQSTLPMLSCAMGAYGAKYLKDKELAKTTWKILLETMISPDSMSGFCAEKIQDVGGIKNLVEIPWISTNFTAQWCLNAIMTLDFIEDEMPKTMPEAVRLVGKDHPERLHTS